MEAPPAVASAAASQQAVWPCGAILMLSEPMRTVGGAGVGVNGPHVEGRKPDAAQLRLPMRRKSSGATPWVYLDSCGDLMNHPVPDLRPCAHC